MPWSQLTKVKNFTVILLYINLRVNIEKDDNIFKIIQVKRYIHIGNKVRMWKFNSKFLMFMKVSNSPTFLRLFLLKILAWGWGCSSAGQWSWALGSRPGTTKQQEKGLSEQWSPDTTFLSSIHEEETKEPARWCRGANIRQDTVLYTVTPQYSW